MATKDVSRETRIPMAVTVMGKQMAPQPALRRSSHCDKQRKRRVDRGSVAKTGRGRGNGGERG